MFLALLSLVVCGFCDEPIGDPTASVSVSVDQRAFVIRHRSSVGWMSTAYRVDDFGQLMLLWESTEIPSSGHIYVGRLGETVAWVTRMVSLDAPEKQKVLIFFRVGKVAQQYSFQDLGLDTNALKKSVSHVRWLRDDLLDPVQLRLNNTLYVKLLDGAEMQFEMESGKRK
jgi:hypothetical protein